MRLERLKRARVTRCEEHDMDDKSVSSTVSEVSDDDDNYAKLRGLQIGVFLEILGVPTVLNQNLCV